MPPDTHTCILSAQKVSHIQSHSLSIYPGNVFFSFFPQLFLFGIFLVHEKFKSKKNLLKVPVLSFLFDQGPRKLKHLIVFLIKLFQEYSIIKFLVYLSGNCEIMLDEAIHWKNAVWKFCIKNCFNERFIQNCLTNNNLLKDSYLCNMDVTTPPYSSPFPINTS